MGGGRRNCWRTGRGRQVVADEAEVVIADNPGADAWNVNMVEYFGASGETGNLCGTRRGGKRITV